MVHAANTAYVDDTALSYRHRANVRLYDSAIAAMNGAIDAIAADDIETRCRAIQEVTEVIATLYLNLDVKRDGACADDLAKIYSHILGLLLRTNLSNDIGIAARVIDLLEVLREGSAEIDALVATCTWPVEIVDATDLTRTAVA